MNIHTKYHFKDATGRSEKIEGYIRRGAEWLKNNGCNPDSMLDIGCDYGFFMIALQEALGRNIYCQGIDPFAEPIFSEIEIPIAKYSGDDVLLPIYLDMKYDLVVLNHSLEHFTNPYLIFRNIEQLCAKELFIAVPKAGTSWAYWDGHYTIWDKQILVKIAGIFGFELIECEEVCFREDFVEIWAYFKKGK